MISLMSGEFSSATQVPVVVEYVWLSGADTHHDIRSKCRTVQAPWKDWNQETSWATQVNDQLQAWMARFVKEWNFDGSSTNQAHGHDTEILIRPVRAYFHPFIQNRPAAVVLCECFNPDGTPAIGNTRALARSVFEPHKDLKPWFGLEQEYVLYQDGRPYKWPAGGFLAPQGPYYCANGPHAIGRQFAQEHYDVCLTMGLKISGTNAEVMPSQWEYQVGPCEGIESGDSLVMSRWVFLRLGEKYGIDASFDCKPQKGDWNGSGLHHNFSTEPMREAGGYAKIKEAIERLSKTYRQDIAFYGEHNNLRLSGKHETSRFDQFSHGVGTRHTSIRIPNFVVTDNAGYFEDRRVASDADPYLSTARLFASACGLPEQLDPVKLGLIRSWMPQ